MRRSSTILCAMAVLLTWERAMPQPIPPETITAKGILVEGGIVCPLLQLGTGELVPLMGIGMTEYPAGTSLEIKGALIQHSPCQQGPRALRVDRVLAVDGVARK